MKDKRLVSPNTTSHSSNDSLIDLQFETTKAILDYERALAPYTGQEFIPNSLLQIVLRRWLPSGSVVLCYSPEHVVVKTTIQSLLSMPISNWEYNRPPDMGRCYDIAKHIYHSKYALDTVIYVSYNNRKETFEMIDGIHRYTALQIIEAENSKPNDFLCAGDFGGNLDATWLYNSEILLNIRFNCPIGVLIECFRNLNKSNPVPELYIRDVKRIKRTIIENVANAWNVKYPTHFSASGKPNKPNVNRDRFIDFLENLYDKHKISEETKDVLLTLLERTNTNIARSIRDPAVCRKMKITKTVMEKCDESGCYLFLYSLEKLADLM